MWPDPTLVVVWLCRATPDDYACGWAWVLSQAGTEWPTLFQGWML